MRGIHGAVYASVMSADIEVALAAAEPVPVMAHVLEPTAVWVPAGAVSVKATAVPEIVPDNVRLNWSGGTVGVVITNGPVMLVPFCVAFHVAGKIGDPAGLA